MDTPEKPYFCTFQPVIKLPLGRFPLEAPPGSTSNPSPAPTRQTALLCRGGGCFVPRTPRFYLRDNTERFPVIAQSHVLQQAVFIQR